MKTNTSARNIDGSCVLKFRENGGKALKCLSVSAAIFLNLLTLGRAADKPNILIIFSDDHACHAISAYGSKINKTPNIDRIAENGAIFRNSFCANAICGPSRACLMSGKHSHANGFVHNWGKSFDGTQPTLFNVLKNGGYQTAIVGKWHLGDFPTDAYGFDYWDLWKGGYYNPEFDSRAGHYTVKGYSTEVITEKVMDWIGKRDKTKPFIALCAYNAPHRTWAPPIKYLNRYKDQTIPEPETLFDNWENRTDAMKSNRQSIRNHFYYSYDLKVNDTVPFASDRENQLKSREYKRMSAEDQKAWDAAYGPENRAFIEAAPTGKDLVRWKYQRYIKDYLRCVDSLDDNVGRLLDCLDKDGLLENTIVIYSSDQGFFLGDHGFYDKRWMFEEAFRMPFLISWPGKIKPGTSYAQMIQNIDYAPTLIDAAGISVPGEMQGCSMLPIFEDKATAWRNSVYYHFYEHGGEHNAPRHEGVRTERYKLINFYSNGGFNLFDLKNDPHEMQDLSKNPEYREVMEKMKTELQKLRKQYDLPPLQHAQDEE